MIRKHRTLFIACLSLLLLSVKALFPNNCRAAEVLIIGDITLKPVVDVVAGIRETLPSAFTVISPSDETGRLAEIVAREGARTVIALGNDAIKDALQLPANIAVIYDLVVLPPKYDRPNTTGMYMGTPVVTYLNFITKHLPSLKKISVISSPQTMEILGGIGFFEWSKTQTQKRSEALYELEALRKGCCVAFSQFSDKTGTEELVVLAEVKQQLSIEELRRFTEQARTLVQSRTGITPAVVEALPRDSLPRTSSGKIRRGETHRRWLKRELSPEGSFRIKETKNGYELTAAAMARRVQ